MDELAEYLHERYYEQIVPIIWQEDENIYYDIMVE